MIPLDSEEKREGNLDYSPPGYTVSSSSRLPQAKVTGNSFPPRQNNFQHSPPLPL